MQIDYSESFRDSQNFEFDQIGQCSDDITQLKVGIGLKTDCWKHKKTNSICSMTTVSTAFASPKVKDFNIPSINISYGKVEVSPKAKESSAISSELLQPSLNLSRSVLNLRDIDEDLLELEDKIEEVNFSDDEELLIGGNEEWVGGQGGVVDDEEDKLLLGGVCCNQNELDVLDLGTGFDGLNESDDIFAEVNEMDDELENLVTAPAIVIEDIDLNNSLFDNDDELSIIELERKNSDRVLPSKDCLQIDDRDNELSF